MVLFQICVWWPCPYFKMDANSSDRLGIRTLWQFSSSDPLEGLKWNLNRKKALVVSFQIFDYFCCWFCPLFKMGINIVKLLLWLVTTDSLGSILLSRLSLYILQSVETINSLLTLPHVCTFQWPSFPSVFVIVFLARLFENKMSSCCRHSGVSVWVG
jgi:hypothetical protein